MLGSTGEASYLGRGFISPLVIERLFLAAEALSRAARAFPEGLGVEVFSVDLEGMGVEKGVIWLLGFPPRKAGPNFYFFPREGEYYFYSQWEADQVARMEANGLLERLDHAWENGLEDVIEFLMEEGAEIEVNHEYPCQPTYLYFCFFSEEELPPRMRREADEWGWPVGAGDRVFPLIGKSEWDGLSTDTYFYEVRGRQLLRFLSLGCRNPRAPRPPWGDPTGGRGVGEQTTYCFGDLSRFLRRYERPLMLRTRARWSRRASG